MQIKQKKGSVVPVYKIKYIFIRSLPYDHFTTINTNLRYTFHKKQLSLEFYLPANKKDIILSNLNVYYDVIMAVTNENINSLLQCRIGDMIFSSRFNASSGTYQEKEHQKIDFHAIV